MRKDLDFTLLEQTARKTAEGVALRVAPRDDPAVPRDLTVAKTVHVNRVLSPGECVAALVLGLLPVIGLIYSIATAYGVNTGAQKRNLARAMLYIHGGALALIIIGACVWVGLLIWQHGLPW